MSGMIVGAGIGGLSAAIAMQRRGMPVQLYEAASALSPVGAGIVLPPNAMNILERYGLAEQVRGHGAPIESFVMLDRHGRTISKIAARYTQNRGTHQAVAIHRGRLQQVLLDALRPNTLFTGKTLVQTSTHADRAEAIFSDGTKASSEFMVGADGIRSAVRKLLFPASTLRYSGQTCWRGVAALTLPVQWINQFTEIWGVGGVFGFAPISETQVYWYATQKVVADGSDDTDHIKQMLTDTYASLLEPIAALIAHTEVTHIIRNDLIDLAPLKSWARGRAVLIGDAAHAVLPNLGQGGAQAIEDSWVLGEMLASSKSCEEAFMRYQKMRLARARKIAGISRNLANISSLCNATMCDIRDALFRRIPAFVTARQFQGIYGMPY